MKLKVKFNQAQILIGISTVLKYILVQMWTSYLEQLGSDRMDKIEMGVDIQVRFWPLSSRSIKPNSTGTLTDVFWIWWPDLVDLVSWVKRYRVDKLGIDIHTDRRRQRQYPKAKNWHWVKKCAKLSYAAPLPNLKTHLTTSKMPPQILCQFLLQNAPLRQWYKHVIVIWWRPWHQWVAHAQNYNHVERPIYAIGRNYKSCRLYKSCPKTCTII